MPAELMVKNEAGPTTLEVFELPTTEEFLLDLIKDIFENYWEDIFFGTHVQGAVWEIKAPNAPKKISILDGYITVDFGPWHFHVCIGETKGIGSQNKTPGDLAMWRKTSRAELYRQIGKEGTPNSWGLRLFNGKNEQQMTVFLPSPFLSNEMKLVKEPNWSRLKLWDHLRKKHLNLEPDPRDRAGKRFRHG